MNYFLNIYRNVFSSVRSFFRREIPYGRTYLLFLSILTGIVSGLLAVFLKYATKAVHRYTVSYALEHPAQLWLLPLLPLLGIFTCVFLVRLFMQNKPYEKSLTAVIKTSADGSSQLPFYHTFAHLITTSLSIGTGISAGLEAPIVLTGSAVGANLGKKLKISSESRTLLISCGGAAGIAAAFNSPVAGILFAGEVLLPSFSTTALVPLLLASASGSIIAHFFYTGETFIQFNAQWQAVNIPFYLLIGLCCGIFSAYTIKINTLVTKYLSSKENIWIKALSGAALLYPIFFFIPALMGEGYTFINALALGESDALLKNTVLEGLINYKTRLLPIFMLILCLLKPLASAVSLESGGDGGIFGPSLCLGAFLGYGLYSLLALFGVQEHSAMVFICSGMGGVIAGVMHAPLTGIFLIAELTGSFQLFIPLMLVTALSSFICKSINKYNVYKTIIALGGEEPEQELETVILAKTKAIEVLETDFLTVKANDTMRTLLKAVMQSKRNIFPVLDEEEKLLGIVREESIRPFLLHTMLYDLVLVEDLMQESGPLLDAAASLEEASRLMEKLNLWQLPVAQNERYIGFVSKAGVLNAYRNMLRHKPELF